MKKLTLKQTILVASTLFGMFFGAGNLIFPILLGQMAGSNMLPATLGFAVTAVGIPILAIAAIGNAEKKSLLGLGSKVSKWYGVAFATVLYLTIGPLFAIPRCASTSFSSGVAPLFKDVNTTVLNLIFSVVFFAAVLIFSLKPNGIMTWIGKIINPIFLLFFLVLIVVSLVNPSAAVSSVEPIADYETSGKAVLKGFIEGYNTMDAIAGLAFGVVVVDMLHSLGLKKDDEITRGTLFSGIFTAILMVVIYVLSILIGTQSRGFLELCENGAVAFAGVAEHYLGTAGLVILALTITFACLKTAIGLVTSCAKGFVELFPKSFSYTTWTIIFTVFSLVVTNFGLTQIIEYSLPVLMLIYPLAIVLILLGMTDKLFGGSRYVYAFAIGFTAIPAICDFVKTLPFGIDMSFVSKFIPFYETGFGWLVPAAIGVVIGVVLKLALKEKKA